MSRPSLLDLVQCQLQRPLCASQTNQRGVQAGVTPSGIGFGFFAFLLAAREFGAQCLDVRFVHTESVCGPRTVRLDHNV